VHSVALIVITVKQLVNTTG